MNHFEKWALILWYVVDGSFFWWTHSYVWICLYSFKKKKTCWSLSSACLLHHCARWFFLHSLRCSFVCSFLRCLADALFGFRSIFFSFVQIWTMNDKFKVFLFVFRFKVAFSSTVWSFVSSISFRFVWLKLIFINDLFLLQSKLDFILLHP